MSRKVEIISKEEVFHKAIFRIEEIHLRHERFDGAMSEPIMRLNLERGDGVAAVVHDPESGSVVLVEQFRPSTYEKGPGWLLELPAGVVEAGDDMLATMQRELVDEIGYRVDNLRHINTFYLSPGGTSERIHLYYARVAAHHATDPGGGLVEEGEDIRIVTVPLTEVFPMIEAGVIADAKTIIGLQWLRLHPLG